MLAKWLTHMAFGRGPQFLTMGISPQGCLNAFKHGIWLLSEQFIQETETERLREGNRGEREIKTKMENTFAFYDLVSKVLHSHFCFILVTRSESLNSAQPQREEN